MSLFIIFILGNIPDNEESNETKPTPVPTYSPAAVSLAPTPPMGWNSWNIFDCDGFNETIIKHIATKLIEHGLAKAGYKYVNLDGKFGFKMYF